MLGCRDYEMEIRVPAGVTAFLELQPGGPVTAMQAGSGVNSARREDVGTPGGASWGGATPYEQGKFW